MDKYRYLCAKCLRGADFNGGAISLVFHGSMNHMSSEYPPATCVTRPTVLVGQDNALVNQNHTRIPTSGPSLCRAAVERNRHYVIYATNPGADVGRRKPFDDQQLIRTIHDLMDCSAQVGL